MSKSTPSLIALLGLVAVAGYQHRGRISEMLSDAQQRITASGPTASPGNGGFLSEIGQLFQNRTGGRTMSTALGDLVARFTDAGQGTTANSWVSDQANRPLGADDLEAALGQEILAELGQKTGLSREELLGRLNAALPEVVNRFTPNGRLPTYEESQTLT